jgi:myo-inositol-1(or 4)-monophosphatase
MSSTMNRARASDTDLTETELKSLLSVAASAAKKAGDIIASNSGGADVTKTKANPRDLLTMIDPLCEETIKETVLSAFPTHDFLGEEDVPPGKEASAAALDAKLKSNNDFLWIVDVSQANRTLQTITKSLCVTGMDVLLILIFLLIPPPSLQPIDGTSNFVHGMPLCMPSIAVAYKGSVVVGVIYDPHRDELFTAMKGYGAELNGEGISVGKQEGISDAIVAMGSPPGEESLNMSLLGIKSLMPKVRTIRMLGSAALMLAWVANGRLTCYWECKYKKLYSSINKNFVSMSMTLFLKNSFLR